ncbi:DUF4083 family protein [Bacillus sp. J33]|uniref:DUF4083 family protein n=1 Tax=Bacillus sp. J33 TaxID=935836 RepID=UPI00047BD416|nr:DUF4083 family protein [Bacillus sp. J33]
MNIGDLFFQLMMLLVLLGLIFSVYFFIRSIALRNKSETKSIEKKLDRIIELLEENKRAD